MNNNKKKMGRKPLPKGEARTEIMYFRATPEEREKIIAEAEAKQTNVSNYLRTFIFSH